jgi:hypothetical protein
MFVTWSGQDLSDSLPACCIPAPRDADSHADRAMHRVCLGEIENVCRLLDARF